MRMLVVEDNAALSTQLCTALGAVHPDAEASFPSSDNRSWPAATDVASQALPRAACFAAILNGVDGGGQAAPFWGAIFAMAAVRCGRSPAGGAAARGRGWRPRGRQWRPGSLAGMATGDRETSAISLP